jgi:sigma-E factor negative regulatory protein RseC
MLIETGQVISIEVDALWVKTIRMSSCGACQARAGCGQSLLNRISAPAADIKALLMDGQSCNDFRVGDEVEIGIESSAVVIGSLLSYVFPLCFLIVAAVLGDYFLLPVWLIFLLSSLSLLVFAPCGDKEALC